MLYTSEDEARAYLSGYSLSEFNTQQVILAIEVIAENVLTLRAFGDVANPISLKAEDVLHMTENRSDQAIALLMGIYSNLQLCDRHGLLITRSG